MTLIDIEDIDWRVMKKAREKPSYFCEKLLGITPYYYQVSALDDKYKFKILLMARQLGKTQTLAFLASQKINMFPGSQVGIIAQNEKRAKEIYNNIRNLQSINPIFADMVVKDLQSELVLDNGSRVQFFASGTEGKSIRGETLDLLLKDEGDFIPEEVYSASLPTVTATDGDIILSSTPNIKYSMFYDIFMDAWDAKQKYEGIRERDEIDVENDWYYTEPIGKKFYFTAYHYDYRAGLNVINPRTGGPQTNMRIVNMFKSRDYYRYEREYLAWWSEEGGLFFPSNSIVGARKPNNYFLGGNKFRVMGLDLGRVNDYTALTILEVNESRDHAVVIDSNRMRKNDWRIITDWIFQHARKWKITDLILDGNNVGDIMNPWLSSLSKEGALFNVVPIKMSIQKKTLIYQNAKIALNMGRVFIQERHLDLMKELMQMTVEETTSGTMKIHAPSGVNKHDDLADSFVLACSVLSVPTDIADQSPITTFTGKSLENYDNYEDVYNSDSFEGIAISINNSMDMSFKPKFSF
jgi:hypothetical protein